MAHEKNTVVSPGSGPDPRGSNRNLSSPCERAETSVSDSVELRRQREVDAWIKCSERFPAIGTTVIAWKCRDGDLEVGRIVLATYSADSHKHRTLIRLDGQWWDCGDRITHWRELPAPPKVEDGGAR